MEAARGSLPEAASFAWRREAASERTLRRDARRWTAWTGWVVGLFALPGAVLLWIEPWTFPVALLCFAHAWAVPSLQARRGARSVVSIGSERSVAGARVEDASRSGCWRTSSGMRTGSSWRAPGWRRIAAASEPG